MIQFTSVYQAVLRYARLRQLLASPRSIPLGQGKTHVSKTETFDRWEKIRDEFASLASCFPPCDSLYWHILMLEAMPHKMGWQRRKILQKITGESFSTWYYNRLVDEAYSTLSSKLRRKGMLLDKLDAS
jgi:hypothetical protein